MVTHKQRIMAALRGEMVDKIPYVPRIDLWYLANSVAGTLPEKHKGRTQNEIARAEGWAVHHMYAHLYARDPAKGVVPEDYVHRGIGIIRVAEMLVDFRIPEDVEVRVAVEDGLTRVEYHTPLGMVSTTVKYNEQMQRLGISIPLHTENLIKKPEDYPAAGYLFEHMEAVPNYERFRRWEKEIGEDGVPVVCFGFHASSPMQQIQRDLIDATQFYFHYKDYQKQIRKLADQMEHLFDRLLEINCESPAEVVMWGSNYDDMLTYPPYFEKEIMPWIRKASDALGAKGKLVLCHTDGENQGLMDLIRDSGMHVAESFCPSPMTKVSLEEYYRRWSDRLTLFGGIPSTIVMADTTSDEDFEAYLDYFFKAVAPGNRMIAGIADQVPPKADFDRLVRIGERMEEEGRLPLEAGDFRPVTEAELAAAAERTRPGVLDDKAFELVQNDIMEGDDDAIKEHVLQMIDEGYSAHDILERGLVAAMDVIGKQFSSGEVFIAEVLLSSRAMNEGVDALAPYLASGEEEEKGKILIGTVAGDVHNIGKNMVVSMLKGAGFEVQDMGIDVPRDDFVEMVAEVKPDILGLSALLTTTMPEMGNVIEGLKERDLLGDVKVIVGGAPVSQKFAEDIGAHGYAADAVEAVAVAKRLIEQGG